MAVIPGDMERKDERHGGLRMQGGHLLRAIFLNARPLQSIHDVRPSRNQQQYSGT